MRGLGRGGRPPGPGEGGGEVKDMEIGDPEDKGEYRETVENIDEGEHSMEIEGGGTMQQREGPRRRYCDVVNNQGIEGECWNEEEAEEQFADPDDVRMVMFEGEEAFELSEAYMQALLRPWWFAVAFKVIGRRIPFRSLKNQIDKIWPAACKLPLMNIENGYYVIRFRAEEDAVKALTCGPWIILGCYLHVAKWDDEFGPFTHDIRTMVSWVRIPKLPIFMYDKALLKTVGRLLGKVVDVDTNTIETHRGQYARIAAEVDMSRPLRSRIVINRRVFQVEYENIHQLCYKCGFVGHTQDRCNPEGNDEREAREREHRAEAEQPQPAPGEKYGPWMTVKPRRRRPPGQRTANQGNSKGQENRFMALQDEEEIQEGSNRQSGYRDRSQGRHPGVERGGQKEGRKAGNYPQEENGQQQQGGTSRAARTEEREGWKRQPSGAHTRAGISMLPGTRHTVVEIQDDSTRSPKRAKTPGFKAAGRPPDPINGGNTTERRILGEGEQNIGIEEPLDGENAEY